MQSVYYYIQEVPTKYLRIYYLITRASVITPSPATPGHVPPAKPPLTRPAGSLPRLASAAACSVGVAPFPLRHCSTAAVAARIHPSQLLHPRERRAEQRKCSRNPITITTPDSEATDCLARDHCRARLVLASTEAPNTPRSRALLTSRNIFSGGFARAI